MNVDNNKKNEYNLTRLTKAELEKLNRIEKSIKESPYSSIYVVEMAKNHKSNAKVASTERSTNASKSSCTSSAAKIHRNIVKPAYNTYDAAENNASKRSVSEEIIAKMKEACDQNIKDRYSSKFKKNFKVNSIFPNHAF